MSGYYCEICFKWIESPEDHQKWCPHYKPPIKFEDLFPGINN